MPDLYELHNQLTGEIIKSIVKPPLEAGGTFADVYVLLEMAKERMLTLRTRIHQ